MWLDGRGNLIRPCYVRIAEDFETGAIMVGDERKEKPADGVLAEIGRNVTDLQATVGIRVVRKISGKRRERGGVLPLPLGVHLVKPTSIVPRMKMGSAENAP